MSVKIRSKIHRQFVSQQPCIITGSTYGVQAHHLLRVEGKGLSTKSCDRWVVPLHYVIHDAQARFKELLERYKTWQLVNDYKDNLERI